MSAPRPAARSDGHAGTGVLLVAGVSGLVGRAAARRALADGWRVIGLSRRRPDGLDGLEHHAVDLLDAAATANVVDELTAVTHVAYAALHEEPGLFGGWLDQDTIDRNVAMLRHLMVPLAAAATGLRHVTLLHGTKAYGVHRPELGMAGLHVPLRERVPVRPHPNFYFDQERLLHDLRDGAGWDVTVFRPTVIVGDAQGTNMNPLLALAAYAVIRRELGEPLHFPGRHPHHLRDLVDADLVGAAVHWAGTSPAAAGGTFNLTNGDVMTWAGVWPALAAAFGMAPGADDPTLLHEWLPAHADVWAAAVARHRLRAPDDVVEFVGANSMIYADLVTGALGSPDAPPPVILSSSIAVRRAGFDDCVDTEDALVAAIARLQVAGTLPRP